ncbi:MAG TPA: phosphatase PAP2 family protein [Gemmatimonadaceae bacterium]|nr:phosphatase PAP2 family protein [Gemmatimonadaceae bacterium]
MIRRLLLLLAALPSLAAAQDTAHVKRPPMFTERDAMWASGFVGATLVLTPFDQRIARWSQRPALQNDRLLSRTASFFRVTGDPGALIIGGSMYGVGRLLGLDRLADLGLHGTEAIVVGGILTGAIKDFAGRARPYAVRDTNAANFQLFRGLLRGDAYQSFPSGHSLAAFAAASAVTAETSRWWKGSAWVIGPVMYGGATAVGLSRMYNNKHWASDVILGAGIGTFSGIKVVQFQHSHPGNRLDRWLLRASVAPIPHGAAFSIAY